MAGKSSGGRHDGREALAGTLPLIAEGEADRFLRAVEAWRGLRLVPLAAVFRHAARPLKAAAGGIRCRCAACKRCLTLSHERW